MQGWTDPSSTTGSQGSQVAGDGMGCDPVQFLGHSLWRGGTTSAVLAWLLAETFNNWEAVYPVSHGNTGFQDSHHGTISQQDYGG